MTSIIIEIIRHIMTLYFGVFLTTDIIGIRNTRNNLAIINVFCIIDLFLHFVIMKCINTKFIINAYPLLTHLPLILLLAVVFKRSFLKSLLSVSVAYLCCQIPNWLSIIPEMYRCDKWAADLTYVFGIVIIFVIIHYLAAPALSEVFNKPDRELIPFCIMPFLYYVFDYSTTVYTTLLYAGNPLVVEFIPFLMCICYFIFCVIYCRQYEHQQKIATQNYFMQLKQEQFSKEMENMKRNERNVALLRHDMRHFLNNITVFIENKEPDKALEYINSLIKKTERTITKQYCANEAINVILLSNADTLADNGIDLRYTITVPSKLDISDIDLTVILQNAIENAINAVSGLPEDKRYINLSVTRKNGKLLISVENPYSTAPAMENNLPVSSQKGHGLGTQSIRLTADRLGGNCQFSVTDRHFIVRLII